MSHHVIYVPGLFDRIWRRIGQAAALQLWRVRGIHTHYFTAGWATQTEDYPAKLLRLVRRIDNLKSRGHTISLVSISAGASLALAAFYERQDAVHSLVCVVGKLRNPQTIAEPLAAANPTLRYAVQQAVTLELKLTDSARQKIMVVQPHDDAIVPIGDMQVRGSKVEHFPTRGHVMTILAALTWQRGRIIKFIKRA